MPRTLKTLIEENTTRQVFQGAVSAWAGRDLDGLMHYVGDEIANDINVDPNVVPFAPSVVGKAAYRDKLQHILDSFEFTSYVTNHLVVDGATARRRGQTSKSFGITMQPESACKPRFDF